jgi:DNA-directed RNA polymerase specialized sigma24 family protein
VEAAGPEASLQHLSDEALWLSHAAGGDAAFPEVRRRHEGALFRYLQLSLGDVRAAAETLGKVLRLARAYRRPYDGFDSLRGWLFAVATQAAVPAHVPQEEGLSQMVADLKRPRPKAVEDALKRALADMHREVKQPFLLVMVMGLPLAEAARACRFPVHQAARRVLSACGEFARLATLPKE